MNILKGVKKFVFMEDNGLYIKVCLERVMDIDPMISYNGSTVHIELTVENVLNTEVNNNEYEKMFKNAEVIRASGLGIAANVYKRESKDMSTMTITVTFDFNADLVTLKHAISNISTVCKNFFSGDKRVRTARVKAKADELNKRIHKKS